MKTLTTCALALGIALTSMTPLTAGEKSTATPVRQVPDAEQADDVLVRPIPIPSPYAGRYSFAAVDLRGENKTAGVGRLHVARNYLFRGHIRNHESGKVARLRGLVLRNGRLEFVPGFEHLRHNIRILHRSGHVHGLAGRYILRKKTNDDGSGDGESGDTQADAATDDDGSDDISDVIRSAGVVLGFRN